MCKSALPTDILKNLSLLLATMLNPRGDPEEQFEEEEEYDDEDGEEGEFEEIDGDEDDEMDGEIEEGTSCVPYLVLTRGRTAVRLYYDRLPRASTAMLWAAITVVGCSADEEDDEVAALASSAQGLEPMNATRSPAGAISSTCSRNKMAQLAAPASGALPCTAQWLMLRLASSKWTENKTDAGGAAQSSKQVQFAKEWTGLAAMPVRWFG